jgi:mono/diheme cytochrome c family protein
MMKLEFMHGLRMVAIVVIAVGGCSLGGFVDSRSPFALQAQAASSVRDGVYSGEQAKRGELLYAKHCASCHGAKLEGRNQAPPLAGPEFVMNWDGMPLSDLFEKIRTSMPADEPGRLSAQENAGVVALMLRENALPFGAADLPADVERLRQIRFEAGK